MSTNYKNWPLIKLRYKKQILAAEKEKHHVNLSKHLNALEIVNEQIKILEENLQALRKSPSVSIFSLKFTKRDLVLLAEYKTFILESINEIKKKMAAVDNEYNTVNKLLETANFKIKNNLNILNLTQYKNKNEKNNK